MSSAYTPSYTFDGSSYNNSYENYSSGDDFYDDFGIDKIEISDTFLTIHFKDSTSMSTWRGSTRSFEIEYPSGTESWEFEADLETSDEYSVNTTYNYIHYTWSFSGLTSTQVEAMTETIVDAGSGTSVVNLTLS